MSSDPNWPSRYSHPTRAAKRANLAEKVAWALKDAQAEIDSLTVLLGQAQKDRDEFARAEDRERTRAECALVARDAAESRAERLAEALAPFADPERYNTTEEECRENKAMRWCAVHSFRWPCPVGPARAALAAKEVRR